MSIRPGENSCEPARQFEALFMQEILKSMRATTMSAGLTDNEGTRLGTEMLDQQFATRMAGAPGGLSDLIARQLERQMGLHPGPIPPARRAKRITIAECYIRADRNDDGIAELLKVTLAGGGDGREMLDVVECDAIPFVSLTPVPIPHKFCGLSIADLVTDLQEIKTALIRNLLDSQYLANNPQVAASNRVDLKDLMDRRVGGVVRVDTEQADVSGHTAPIVVPTMSAEGFGMLEYMDSILRQRTGVGDEVMGLDASSLSQIQTTALAQAYDAARMRIEMPVGGE